ncbi:MAG: SsrA-binding protein SmpB [Phycisphaeraceae bacterium]|nr:SsrA-binding protein SmpB [Phycisphaeraceae bacterium]
MAKGKSKANTPPTIENRKARFDYDLGDRFEVGIKLVGSEVKSLRAGRASIAEGFVRADGTPPVLTLHGVNIAEYGPASSLGHVPTRVRTLLAHKKEIERLAREVSRKGVTIVPLRVYFKDGFAKVLIAIATGRGKGDKREAVKTREAQRDIQRAMSRKRIG